MQAVGRTAQQKGIMSKIYVDYIAGEVPAKIAVTLMTDEWIQGNNYSEQTIMDTRDALIAAQQGVHWTAYAVIGLAIFVLGAVVGFWLAGI